MKSPTLMTLLSKHRVIVLYLAYLGPVTTQSPGKSNPIKGCGYCTIPLGYYSNFGYPNPNIIDNPQIRKKIKACQDKRCVLCLLWYPFFTSWTPTYPQKTPNETSINPQIRKEVKLILPWQKMFPVSWSRWSTLLYLDAQNLSYSTLKFSFFK